MTEHTTTAASGDVQPSDGGNAPADEGETGGRPTPDEPSVAGRDGSIGGPSEQRDLPLDQTFEILKNQRRRYVIEYLYAADGQVSLSELAEQIAAWENEKEVRQISSSERKRVYVGLYQCHLPKMDSMDVVSFNKPRGTIERDRNLDSFRQYLQDDGSEDLPTRHTYTAGLSILGSSLLPVAVSLQTDAVAPLLATVLVVCAVTFAAVRHLSRRGGDGSDESTTF